MRGNQFWYHMSCDLALALRQAVQASPTPAFEWLQLLDKFNSSNDHVELRLALRNDVSLLHPLLRAGVFSVDHVLSLELDDLLLIDQIGLTRATRIIELCATYNNGAS